jgi:hypothetical protein
LITDVGAELAALPEGERPGTVVVVVLTDGHENSSHEWTHDAVGAAIRRQESEYAWDFLFLGANMDAVQIGTALGIKADRSMTWDTTGGGVVNAMASAGAYVSRKRSAGPAAAPVEGFSEADRTAARGRASK